MSDELDWELSDMFDNGLFAFPVYEQNAARRVVRYLLKRGVPDEEIASAIQGSTIDLHAWLNRRGKPMFGEWAMAWMNETRELHQTINQRRPIVYRNGSLNDSDDFSRGSSDSDDSDGGSDFFRSRGEADDGSSLSSSAFSAFTGSTLDFHSDIQSSRKGGGDGKGGDGKGGGIPCHPDLTTDSFTSVRSCKDSKDTRQTVVAGSRSGVVLSHVGRAGAAPKLSVVTHSTDSGNASDVCSCRSKSSTSQKEFKVNINTSKVISSNVADASLHSCNDEPNGGGGGDGGGRDGGGEEGVATKADCKCKLAHYIRRQKISAN